ncbi:uncharacterized protein LOC135357058 [Latimeria chalumnae]|uniref:uncharacterized protein LOC135357058 n=1 Tax=Latimeria chalumnae TaxID=7897 RepID=UPI00313DCE83
MTRTPANTIFKNKRSVEIDREIQAQNFWINLCTIARNNILQVGEVGEISLFHIVFTVSTFLPREWRQDLHRIMGEQLVEQVLLSPRSTLTAVLENSDTPPAKRTRAGGKNNPRNVKRKILPSRKENIPLRPKGTLVSKSKDKEASLLGVLDIPSGACNDDYAVFSSSDDDGSNYNDLFLPSTMIPIIQHIEAQTDVPDVEDAAI